MPMRSCGEEREGKGLARVGEDLAFRIAWLRPAARGLVLAGPSHLSQADGCSPTGKGHFPGATLAFRHRSLEFMNS